jgi:Holliday junction resolvase RusA-like endonuclease
MAEVISLIIPGPPCGKGRPRFARAGRFTRTYSPEKTVNAETLIRELYAYHYGDHEPMRGAVSMYVRAYFPIPKSTPKRRRALMATERVPHCSRPDADNIAKLAMDSLSKGVAFNDDAQVYKLDVYKYYSSRPRLEIDVCEQDDLTAASVGAGDTVRHSTPSEGE